MFNHVRSHLTSLTLSFYFKSSLTSSVQGCEDNLKMLTNGSGTWYFQRKISSSNFSMSEIISITTIKFNTS